MKRVGVVIPIYNTERYLNQCIDSVLQQSYTNLSIVLVDDGSTDGGPKICDEYAKKDSRVLVIHQENMGKLAARYYGAKAADCDYLTFVDSDDWILPETYGIFTEQMELGIDVISWQFIRYFSSEIQRKSHHLFSAGFYDNERFQKEIYPSMIWNLEKNTFGMDPSLCNKLIKREFTLKALASTQSLNIAYGDDVATIYPLLQSIHTLFLSEEGLYFHRQRSHKDRAYYLQDQDFYKKLYSLYEHLKFSFSEEPAFIEQLDAFYSHSVLLHLAPGKREKLYPQSGKYLFPFDKVPFGKKIILYGASTVGQDFYKQISCLGYASKILWVDKNYLAYQDFGVKNIETLENASEYDYAVIAIKDESTANEVKKYLSKQLQGFPTQVVWSVKNLSKY